MTAHTPIVRVERGHADLLAALHKLCFAESWNEHAMANLLAMPGAFALIAGSDGKAKSMPAGFIICRVAGADCDVIAIGVRAQWRRRGIASRLLSAAFAEAAMQGAGHMLLEVAEDNRAANRLYRGVGFVPVGRRPAYYRQPSGPDRDALLLARELLGESRSSSLSDPQAID